MRRAGQNPTESEVQDMINSVSLEINRCKVCQIKLLDNREKIPEVF